jgi:hypothetical protein
MRLNRVQQEELIQPEISYWRNVTNACFPQKALKLFHSVCMSYAVIACKRIRSNINGYQGSEIMNIFSLCHYRGIIGQIDTDAETEMNIEDLRAEPLPAIAL